MKIVFYNHTGKVSGAERVLMTVLARLDAAIERVLLCPIAGPLAENVAATGTRVEDVAELGARFTWRPDRLISYLLSFRHVITEFRRKIVALDADLIHANSIRAGLVATAATVGLQTKVVWHLHDLLPAHPFSSAIRLFAACSRRSRMIAVSEAVRNNFCGRLTTLLGSRVTVILNAIDVQSFLADNTDRNVLRERLSIREGEFAVGIVGQLTPRKGQLELLIAFADFLQTNPAAVLLIVGAPIFNRDADYEQELRQKAAQLGINHRVRMLGNRNDVRDVMRALDLLVVNSRREPFGLVACEAMACGTPVLATAADGLPEIIKHEQNGWLVPCGDRSELVRALRLLSEDAGRRKHLASTALQDIARRFTIERYIDELEDFYQRISDEHFTIEKSVPASGQNQPANFAEYYHERI